jgi:hypothetical protein
MSRISPGRKIPSPAGDRNLLLQINLDDTKLLTQNNLKTTKQVIKFSLILLIIFKGDKTYYTGLKVVGSRP